MLETSFETNECHLTGRLLFAIGGIDAREEDRILRSLGPDGCLC